MGLDPFKVGDLPLLKSTPTKKCAHTSKNNMRPRSNSCASPHQSPNKGFWVQGVSTCAQPFARPRPCRPRSSSGAAGLTQCGHNRLSHHSQRPQCPPTHQLPQRPQVTPAPICMAAAQCAGGANAPHKNNAAAAPTRSAAPHTPPPPTRGLATQLSAASAWPR